MATSLGSLVVRLGLDAAEFTTGLTKSEAEAKRFAAALDRGIATGATVAASALVVMGGAAVAALVAVNRLASEAGHFQDIAEKVGASSEAIAGFAVALHVTGKSADDLGDFMVKLGKNLVGVEDGTDKAGAALISLGINIKQFKDLDPAAKVDALSKALAKFSDQGEGKSNVLEALGRGGAALLPFLKELNEAGGRQTILTKEQIEQADRYSDAQARSTAQLKLYAEAAATRVLPAITSLIDAAKEFIKELTGIDSTSAKLANDHSIESWADAAARKVAFLVDAVDGVGRAFQIVGLALAANEAGKAAFFAGELSRAKAIAVEANADIERILNKPLFSTKLEQAIANRPGAFVGPPAPDRPAINFNGPPKAGSDAAQSILAGQLRALEQAIQREKDELNARQDFLNDYFRQGLLSVDAYYDQLGSARDKELNAVLAFYDQEIAATRAFAAKAKNAQETQNANNKIADIQDKQARLVAQAGFDQAKLDRERQRAAQEYADQLDELTAKMLDLAGATDKAASIRFDAQNRIFQNRLTSSGDTAGLAALQALKAQEVTLRSLANAERAYGNEVERVGIATARIDLLQSTGSLTEIDAINKKADLARQYVPILTQQAELYERIAAGLAAGPDKDAAIIRAQRLRLEIEQLAAATDVLAKKFNDIFAGAVADGITALVEGTKSLKDALKDVGKSISTQLTQIAAKQVSEQLFAKGGALGGVGEFFAGIFGGGSKATEGATLAAAGTSLSFAGTSLNASAVALSSAAVALTASSSANAFGSAFGGGNSGLGDILKIFGDVPFFAAGGRPRVGGLNVVGENGPELFVPDVSGTIIPASELANRRAQRGNITVNVTVPAGTSRASAHQIAVETGRRVSVAQRKNR